MYNCPVCKDAATYCSECGRDVTQGKAGRKMGHKQRALALIEKTDHNKTLPATVSEDISAMLQTAQVYATLALVNEIAELRDLIVDHMIPLKITGDIAAYTMEP